MSVATETRFVGLAVALPIRVDAVIGRCSKHKSQKSGNYNLRMPCLQDELLQPLLYLHLLAKSVAVRQCD